VEGLKSFIDDKSFRLFEELGILSERELEVRYEIKNEIYTKKIQIESRILGDLAINHIIPTAIAYQNVLIKNVQGLKEVMDEETFKDVSEVQIESITDISHHIKEIRTMYKEMLEQRKIANKIEPEVEKAEAYSDNIKPYFEQIRYHIDKLELMVDDEMWPLPKYRELLFVK